MWGSGFRGPSRGRSAILGIARGEAPTFPGTADDLGAQAYGAIVLAVGIDAHLRREDAGLKHVLHLAIGVRIGGQYLQREEAAGEL